jgi:hypothetical protein
MSAAGNWDLVVATPLGERRATLLAKTEGGALTGSQTAEGNTIDIFDGRVSGNAVSWKVNITDPMPLTLEFSGTVDGDTLSGSVQLGALGTSSFSGTRA